VLVTGGGGGSFDGLAATLMRYLTNGSGNSKRAAEPVVTEPPVMPTALEAAEPAEDESRPGDVAGPAT